MTLTQWLQTACAQWCIRTFGSEIANSRKERALRVVEEAIELAQCEEVPLDVVERLAKVVYSRPVGQYTQEIGGVAVTLAIYSEAVGQDLQSCFSNETLRILDKPAKRFQDRQAEKTSMGVALD